jgi:hypothetical protein
MLVHHHSQVDPRDILAANVNALIERADDPRTHRKLVAKGIPNGTLGRVRAFLRLSIFPTIP